MAGGSEDQKLDKTIMILSWVQALFELEMGLNYLAWNDYDDSIVCKTVYNKFRIIARVSMMILANVPTYCKRTGIQVAFLGLTHSSTLGYLIN